VVVFEVWRRHSEGSGVVLVPVAPPPSPEISPSAVPEPSPLPPAPAPRASPSPLPSPPAAAPEPRPDFGESSSAAADVSRLVVDFEHGFEGGTLTVFVDDQKVMVQSLSSRVTKKILGLRRRKGSVVQTLAVRPGMRRVRVLVTWDDDQRSETVAGTFEGGRSRRLVARLSRIGKDLSLDWK